MTELPPVHDGLAILFQQAFDGSGTLILSRTGEQFTASGYFRGERPRSRIGLGSSLEEALRSLVGREKKKRCPGCGVIKPHHQYSHDKSRYDGLTPYCLICHRQKRKQRQAA